MRIIIRKLWKFQVVLLHIMEAMGLFFVMYLIKITDFCEFILLSEFLSFRHVDINAYI